MSLITWLIIIILVLNTIGAIFTRPPRSPRYFNDLGLVTSADFPADYWFRFLSIRRSRLVNQEVAADSTRI